MRTRSRGAAALIVVGVALATGSCGSPGSGAHPYVSSDALDAYRGQNDLVTLLPSGALTAMPDVYETVWGRAFLDEIGHEVPELDPAALGELLEASGETPLWQGYYACLATGDAPVARAALDSTGTLRGAVEEAEAALTVHASPSVPADVQALDAIAAVHTLGCLESADVGEHVEPVLRLVEGTGAARLALEAQLLDALPAGSSNELTSSAPLPQGVTRECVGVDAYAAAAAVGLGRASFDDVAGCLTPYATYLADTQVLYRLTAAGGPEEWLDALVEANVADVVSRMQEDGIVVGRSNDSGSAGSTLTALRLLRLAGDPEESAPSWVADGLATELDRLSADTETLETDLVRHACVLADAPCGDRSAHEDAVRQALSATGPADGEREAYARMAYELGLHVELDGEVDARTALADRELLCVAAAFELADPGATDVEGLEGAWQTMIDHLAAGDVVGASCASWLWRVSSGGHGDDTDDALWRAVEETFTLGDDRLWRSELHPAGDLALSFYLYDVIGLA